MIIRFWDDINDPTQEVEINENDISGFGCYCKKSWTKKGTFKKFYKYYYIVINGLRHSTGELIYKELKTIFKSRCTSEHSTEVVRKGYSDRKGTDWDYTVIK